MLLTKKEILEGLNKKPFGCVEHISITNGYADELKGVAKAQLKKFIEFLKEHATFVGWEGSKGVWNIVIDDITWQALIKEADDGV